MNLKLVHWIMHSRVTGGGIFEKNVGQISCCSRLLWDPKSKILLSSDAFSLGAGPQKILPVTLKSVHKNFFFKSLKVIPEIKCVPYFT